MRPDFHRKACRSPEAVSLLPTIQPRLLMAKAAALSPPNVPRSRGPPGPGVDVGLGVAVMGVGIRVFV